MEVLTAMVEDENKCGEPDYLSSVYPFAAAEVLLFRIIPVRWKCFSSYPAAGVKVKLLKVLACRRESCA